jgi:hypothetical protein
MFLIAIVLTFFIGALYFRNTELFLSAAPAGVLSDAIFPSRVGGGLAPGRGQPQ